MWIDVRLDFCLRFAQSLENKLTQKSINEIEIIDLTKEKILTNTVKIIDSEK